MATTARMPAIWKHPRTNGYYLRRHIPPELRPMLGWERRISLRTKDARVAKQRYPAAAAQVDQEILEARQALAQEQHEVTQDALQDAFEASPTPAWRDYDYRVRQGLPVAPEDEPLDRWRQPFTSTPVAKLLNINRPEQIQEALKAQPDGPVAVAPQAGVDTASQASVTLQAVFEAWAAERQPPERTRYEWLRAINALASHMEHPRGATELPAEEVTKQALVSWKAALLAEGKSGKTVKNRFDVIRALYNYALDNGLLPDGARNPARGLKVATKSDPATRRLPYSEEDAKVILSAARQETGARRWIPWLLMFTGCRLDEVCQLTKGDVKHDPEGGWYLDIHHGEPGEGRRLKNLGSARRVPLHQQVIDEGFLEFVAELPEGDGPLLRGAAPLRSRPAWR